MAGLGLRTVFEPGKMHPKDWGNPGRVRCALKEAGGRAVRVANSECEWLGGGVWFDGEKALLILKPGGGWD